MHSLFQRLAFFSAIILLAGCAGIGQVVRDEQTITIAEKVNAMKDPLDRGAIYAWHPHTTAMLVDGKGNRCVRVAGGARVTGGESETTAKLQGYKELIKGLDVGSKEAVEQAFLRLNTGSELANILDVVLFHHCVQDMNGTFKHAENRWKGEQTMELYKAAMDVVKSAYSSGQLRVGAETAKDAGAVQGGKGEPKSIQGK